MRAVLWLLPLLQTFAAGAFDVAVSIGGARAKTRVSSLTSVTMDVCVAKQRFPFGDKDLLGLTAHLGGSALTLNLTPKP